MDTISISDLKTNPSKAIDFAADFPVAIENRNKVKAYLLGKDLYEKIVSYIENVVDKKAVKETDFKKGKDFESVAKKLNI
ncbi:type II toxin-antitoxin system Phd/YefM family antitoxin [Candidatus Roizmanbacteria bacterium]|nr:type II toxin-antitoxin system Phd/YefM family antitoxin [Candidatus Roizmanbacteria bacterium]